MEGLTPQDVCVRYHKLIMDSSEEFGFSVDVYSRTTSKSHHMFAADFFRKLYDDGKLVEKTLSSSTTRMPPFLADRYFLGTCPHCGNPNAYGDSVRMRFDWSPLELINPHSTILWLEARAEVYQELVSAVNNTRTGSSSGSSRSIRSGDPTSTASARAGSTWTCSRAP
jgi:methionyl-tRNA synthetase